MPIVIWLLGLLALMLCSCASVETSVKRSEYSKDSWIINSIGNSMTFEESVLNDAKKQAAEKSNSEGRNCFVVDRNRIFTREARTTTTMYGKSSDGSSFSYEVPSELHYSLPWVLLFVSFHKYDECKNFEITKGKDNVFYNNETIENAKSVENKNLAKEILIWGVVLFPLYIPLLLIIL